MQGRGRGFESLQLHQDRFKKGHAKIYKENGGKKVYGVVAKSQEKPVIRKVGEFSVGHQLASVIGTVPEIHVQVIVI